MKRAGDKFENGECRPCEKPEYLGFKYIGKGKAGSRLVAHCPKYYYIITLLHYKRSESSRIGFALLRQTTRQRVNETTSRAAATCRLVVSWTCSLRSTKILQHYNNITFLGQQTTDNGGYARQQDN